MGKASRRQRDLRSAWRRRRGESREGAEFRRLMAADEREGLYRRLGTIRLGGVIVPLVEPAACFPLDPPDCNC
jgi:hypothetical protein